MLLSLSCSDPIPSPLRKLSILLQNVIFASEQVRAAGGAAVSAVP